jgi:hypothetical protein
MVVSAIVLIATRTPAAVVGFAGSAWFFYRLVAARFLCRERLVLVLRRFRRYDKEARALPDFVGDVCAGLAVPITIQDASFKGELPLGLQALQRYVAPFVAAGAAIGAMLLFAGRSEMTSPIGVAIGLGTFLGGYALAAQWFRRRGVFRADDENYARALEKLLSWVRTQRGFYSGTRVMTFPDSRWREAVVTCLREADAIVVDVTDLSPNVGWEIRQTFDLVPAESIIVAWRTGADGTAVTMSDFTRRTLEALVGPDKLARCTHRPYPQSRDSIPAVLNDVFATDLARCFAQRHITADDRVSQ